MGTPQGSASYALQEEQELKQPWEGDKEAATMENHPQSWGGDQR